MNIPKIIQQRIEEQDTPLLAYKAAMDEVFDGKLSLLNRDEYRNGFYAGYRKGATFGYSLAAEMAVEFAEWLHYNQFVRYVQSKDGAVPFGENKGTNKNVWVSTKIHYSPDFYTTDQLFTLFLDHKNQQK